MNWKRWRHRLGEVRNIRPTGCSVGRHDFVHTITEGHPTGMGEWRCRRCGGTCWTDSRGEVLSLPEPQTWQQRRLGFTYDEVPTRARLSSADQHSGRA